MRIPVCASRHVPSPVSSGLLAFAAFAAAPALGCELVTHAGDFEVYDGLCRMCPDQGGDLRHAPCPNPSDAPDDGVSYVFAARNLYFGHPADWQPPNTSSFRLGYDIDCSDRVPSGKPVLCRPREVTAKEPPPWIGLPHGIDNSLTTRIFAPLYDLAAATGQEVDLDKTYSAGQYTGETGLIVQVGDWNGTPDDPSVNVSVYSSPGVAKDSGIPRWDGTDVWDLYADVPGNESKYFKIAKTGAYVAGGKLVVDYRDQGAVSYRFGSPTLSFRIILKQVFFVGDISPSGLTYFTMVAVADLVAAYEELPELARVLAGCNGAGETFLKEKLPDLLFGAADVPGTRGTSPSEPCDGISFSWAFDAPRAKLGGFGNGPAPSPDGGCL